MADLNVQPKRKPIWPWLLLLIVIAAIIFYLGSRSDALPGGESASDSGEQVRPLTNDSVATP